MAPFYKSLSCLLAAVIFTACGSSNPALSNTNMNHQTDLQGHRGSRGLMPENTIPAMIKAIDLGVHTLEMDVVISADKKVVVSHDVFFHHNITTTPEGKTLTKPEAEKLLLYQMNYDSISKYDVGMKPHPDFPRQLKMAVHKPLLSDLIRDSELHGKQTGRLLNYNIEIKSKPANDGKKHPPIEEFVDLAISVIKDAGVLDRTIMQSFDPRALQVIKRKYPSVATSLLIEGTDRRSLDVQLAELGFTPNAYSPHYSLVNAELMELCRQKGIKVIPWTVNNVEEMKRLVALKVDGIISDYPDLFSEINTRGN